MESEDQNCQIESNEEMNLLLCKLKEFQRHKNGWVFPYFTHVILLKNYGAPSSYSWRNNRAKKCYNEDISRWVR